LSRILLFIIFLISSPLLTTGNTRSVPTICYLRHGRRPSSTCNAWKASSPPPSSNSPRAAAAYRPATRRGDPGSAGARPGRSSPARREGLLHPASCRFTRSGPGFPSPPVYSSMAMGELGLPMGLTPLPPSLRACATSLGLRAYAGKSYGRDDYNRHVLVARLASIVDRRKT
jgi:hypothetical protein